MAVLAVAGVEESNDDHSDSAALRGAQFLLDRQRSDGGIYTAASVQYPVYSTAVAVLAVSRVIGPEFDDALRCARDYLIDSQHSDDVASPDYGGFPGIAGGYADLLTTQWVLEALYITDRLAYRDAEELENIYDRALLFIRRCQRSSSADAHDGGVFFDSPRQLGEQTTAVSPATPTNAFLRTAAGLKSLIYGRAVAGDPQLTAALDWIYARLERRDEFMESVRSSAYTSFYFVGQALRAVERAAVGPVTVADRVAKWRERVAVELLGRQNGDGGWPPGEQAWWENHPDLVTAYAVLTLQGFLR